MQWISNKICTLAETNSTFFTLLPPYLYSDLQKFGARVVIEGAHILESKKYAEGLVAAEGLTYVNGYDDPPIIAGAGTIGMEVRWEFLEISFIAFCGLCSQGDRNFIL